MIMLIKTFCLGTLSDRELRTLAADMLPLPLDLNTIQLMEGTLKNCSRDHVQTTNSTSSQKTFTEKTSTEKYFDEEMPLVTRELFLSCDQIFNHPGRNASKIFKYKHEIVGEDDNAFKMIRNNISFVLHQLDWIRKNRRKFVCLNDNLDHEREDTKTIRTILHDFYEAMFPLRSQFELPSKFRNRFLYKEDLDRWTQDSQWRSDSVNYLCAFCIIFIILFIFRRQFTLFLIGLCRLFRVRKRERSLTSINLHSI